jgi:hypothetical protein
LSTAQTSNITSDRSDICEATAAYVLCKIDKVNADFHRVMAVVESGFCSGLEGKEAEEKKEEMEEEEEEEEDKCPTGEDTSNIIPKCQNCQKCKVIFVTTCVTSG